MLYSGKYSGIPFVLPIWQKSCILLDMIFFLKWSSLLSGDGLLWIWESCRLSFSFIRQLCFFLRVLVVRTIFAHNGIFEKIKETNPNFCFRHCCVGKKIVTCSQILSHWQICGCPIFLTWVLLAIQKQCLHTKNWLKSPIFLLSQKKNYRKSWKSFCCREQEN